MGKSRYPITALVVLLILSFAFTPVLAQSEPPQPGSVNPDGLVSCMIPSSPGGSSSGLLDQWHVVFPSAFADWETNMAMDPAPISPANEDVIFDKQPTFRFTPLAGATKYRIQVLNLATGTLDYTFTGKASCTDTECDMRPTYALKYYTYVPKGGIYAWHVTGKVGDQWSEYGPAVKFLVIKPGGFLSTFSVLDPKWLPIYGSWGITPTGTFKTGGVVGFFSSVLRKHAVWDGYVYEVKMKRTGALSSPNRIYFDAFPTTETVSLADKQWAEGYYFEYTNDQTWTLGSTVDGISDPIATNPSSSAILPSDWNTLTVMVAAHKIDLWINGEFVGSCSGDTSYMGGFVGIGMTKDSAGKSPLQVDSAKLEYTTIAPYPLP